METSKAKLREKARVGTMAVLTLLFLLHSSYSQEKPSVDCPLVSDPPVIDGFLNDRCWMEAGVITDFKQVEPEENAKPTEETHVFLCHDQRMIYIGFICFDGEPGKIRATQRKRDARLDPDDRVEILIDTFHDGRNAYFFQIGAGGSIGDGLIGENGRRFDKTWDGIFYGEAIITKRGWEAELAIPATTIRFDRQKTTWGINFSRYIKRKNEVLRWASPYRNIKFFTVSEAGELKGMKGLKQGLGLSFKPYSKACRKWDRTRGRHMKADWGGDIFFNFIPTFTAVFTYNTDFAEAEVDARRINLTRFPLFFPEKRDFFLEAAPAFDFGFARSALVPFFSRRIGMDSQGRPIPILYGLKLVGRIDDYGIGFLSVHTEKARDVPEKGLAAFRVTRNIMRESTIGIIGTSGNPLSSNGNKLVGLDFDLRTSYFMGRKTLSFQGYGLKTVTSGVSGQDLAYGLKVDFPNEPFGFRVSGEDIQENFDPAMGFVSRKAVRRYQAGIYGKIRPRGAIRWVTPGISFTLHQESPGSGLEDAGLGITPLDIFVRIR